MIFRFTKGARRCVEEARSLGHDSVGDVEAIASGTGVRNRARLSKQYGRGRWRKLKGIARVQLADGTIRLAEVHWYEAHGIGKKEFKLKLPFLDQR